MRQQANAPKGSFRANGIFKGRQVLIGTVSIEKSERLSELLERRGIKHNVLNAKQHGREADIVSQAGSLDAVTIATNMAGRGTDILQGGKRSVQLSASGQLSSAGAAGLGFCGAG